MRDNDTSALRAMFQYCDPHLDQTKLNDLLPLTIDGVLVEGVLCQCVADEMRNKYNVLI